MLNNSLISLAEICIATARKQKLKLAIAESCTGGLIAAYLTSVPGASDVFERGFVTYSNEAKQELLHIPADLIAAHGEVSDAVVRAMAQGALRHGHADISVAVTGIAGPDGGSPSKPIGLVYIGSAKRNGPTWAEEHRFGDIGRAEVREQTALRAMELFLEHIIPE